ncbi:lactonase family protein [Hyunsoonleella flava]|uniref:Lactonase family protein n=1 Tax=Hyunsoonleella flava TaxID=2527939 RepID=A0A4V2J9S2_9FLAO|nr:lactonase family protein [Hyunsoonleella flava]TBM99028.1 lactonase family protein [Hyunsoonleella flava]
MKFIIHLTLLVFCLKCYSQTSPLYVGTYTKGNSKGIYQLNFNTETGELSDLKLAIPIDNPSFLTYSPDRKYLYSTNGSESGFISSYKIKDDGSLQLLTRVSSKGKGPCHISIRQDGQAVSVSNYVGGSIAIYSVNEDGSLAEASQVFNQSNSERASHAHSSLFFKDELFVADLGRNALFQYVLQNDQYQLKSDGLIKTKGNPGPRHFKFTKDGNFIYVINEYGATITSIKRTKKGFKQIDKDNTLEPGFTEFNKCADIHISEDERFIYGSNRGENTIAVFERNTKNGKLNKIQSMSVHGDWPRNFTIDPTGKFLLVANMRTENIAVFSINKSNGKLTYLHDFKVPEPVCLLF